MLFLLLNAPTVFQNIVNAVLEPVKNTTYMAYMDDLLASTGTLAKGIKTLHEFICALQEFNMTLRLKWCSVFKEEVVRLGLEIPVSGMNHHARKLQSID